MTHPLSAGKVNRPTTLAQRSAAASRNEMHTDVAGASAVGFTPGPWHVNHEAVPGFDHRDRIITDDAGDKIVAARGDGVVGSIRNANAALIAAAPDLYSACESLVRFADFNNRINLSGDLKQAVTIARHALAIARGEVSK